MRSIFSIKTFLISCICFIGISHKPVKGAPKNAQESYIAGLNSKSQRFFGTNPDSAYYYGQLAYELAKIAQNVEEESNALRNIGSSYFALGQYQQALEYYRNAYTLAIQNNYKSGELRALSNIGLINQELGNYHEALESLFEALASNKTINDPYANYATIHNIGKVYYNLKDYENAASYLNDAINRYENNDRVNFNSMTYVLLAKVKREQGELDKAKELLHEAVEFSQKRSVFRSLATAYFELGVTFERERAFETAEFYLQKSLELFEKLKDKKGKAETYLHLACVALSTSKFSQTHLYLEEGLQLALEVKAKSNLKQYYGIRAKYYEAQGMFEQALQATKIKHQYHDSLFNENSALKIERFHVNRVKKLSEASLALKEQEITKNRLITYFLLSTLVLIVALTIAITSRYRMIKKVSNKLTKLSRQAISQKKKIEQQHKILSVKNNELENAQKIIKTQNQYLEEINADLEEKVQNRTQKLKSINKELETLVYRASHDLKSPITSILGLTEIARIQVKDSGALELFSKIKECSESQKSMLEDLFHSSQIRLTSLQISTVDFEAIFKQTFEELKALDQQKHKTKLTYSLELQKEFYTDKYLLSLIFKQLFMNAILYKNVKEKNPFLNITIIQEKHGVSIRIKDNGIGIEKGLVHKAFDIFFRASNRSSGNGLGLYIVKKAVEKLNGEVSIESQILKGTEVKIWLPSLCKPKVVKNVPHFDAIHLN